MITTFVRRTVSTLLARLGEPNPEVLAVFHPPGTMRVISPAEHAALRGRQAPRERRPR